MCILLFIYLVIPRETIVKNILQILRLYSSNNIDTFVIVHPVIAFVSI